jgi:hypothetical protein
MKFWAVQPNTQINEFYRGSLTIIVQIEYDGHQWTCFLLLLHFALDLALSIYF